MLTTYNPIQGIRTIANSQNGSPFSFGIILVLVTYLPLSRPVTSRDQRRLEPEPPYSLNWVREGRKAGPPKFRGGGEAGRKILSEVTQYGLDESIELQEIKEQEFFDNGHTLEPGHPGLYLAAFSMQKQKTKDLAKFGYASLRASELLSDQFLLTRTQATFGLERVDLQRTSLYENCPFKSEEHLKPSCPSYSVMYRTLDGTCNNLDHPEWGAAFRPFWRFLPPDYSDGIKELRTDIEGEELPNPRRVSAVVHRPHDNPSKFITQMVMQWGQFLDHDLTAAVPMMVVAYNSKVLLGNIEATAQPRGFNHSVPKCCDDDTGEPLPKNVTHPDCLPIRVFKNDTFYSRWRHTCMEFLRSSPAPRANCALGPREQINQVTGFIDGSNVYGSDDHEMAELRMWEDGMLKYKPIRFRKPLLPPLEDLIEGECRENSKNLHCFKAGDLRVNEQPALAAMHTMWLREHNRVASGLAEVNPQWNDDRLFFEARKIVGAEMQKITFAEWLPIVLGPAVMKIFRLPLQRNDYYRGYKSAVNPTVANAFGAAAFRFGHSLVQRSLARCDKTGRRFPFSIRLHNELMNPANIHNFGSVDRLLLGLVFERPQNRDVFITDELTRHLFQSPGHHHGMDLASINIQRGRDHGIPSYNIWREQCGLHRFQNWGELLTVIDDDTVGRLKSVYSHVDDIDLFTGGLAERPAVRALVGPTFACILGQQFLNLRQGDRFWFENGGLVSSFKPKQLAEIRKSTLARVLCDNLDDIQEIHPKVMRPSTLKGGRNKKVSCNNSELIPKIDFTAWREKVDDNFPGLLYSGGDFAFNFSSLSKESAHYSGPSAHEDEVPPPSGLPEEELFYMESEEELQEMDSTVRYSLELPTPFQNQEEKLGKESLSSSALAKGAPSWYTRAGSNVVTQYNFKSVIKEAYTDTLFYRKK